MSDTRKHQRQIAVRMTDAGHAYIDDLAARTGTTRSDVLRAMFTVASRHGDDVVAALTNPTT